MFGLAVVLLMSFQSSADIRARLADEALADNVALATITFPGFDASDDAVKASALHYCGKADECVGSFLDSRDHYLRLAALDRRQKQALKILVETSDGFGADWRVAETLYNARYHPTQAPRLPTTSIRCRTSSSGRTAYTTCTPY